MSPDPSVDTFEIVRLGERGDGIAERDGETLYVPRALPGERWQTAPGGGFLCAEPTGNRATPSCVHFEHCGGCVAQHMPDDLYRAWKAELVAKPLRAHGIAYNIDPAAMWCAPSGTRRRVALGATGTKHSIHLGFRASRSHDIVDVVMCPVADPAIVSALPLVRALMARLARDRVLADDVRVHILVADGGLDIDVSNGANAQTLSAFDRTQLADIASEGQWLRLRIDDVEIFQQTQPMLLMGDTRVPVPAGAFVQAVGSAETAMAEVIVQAVRRAKRVADLFCGLGAFTFPLARRARVTAVDHVGEAIAALIMAARHCQGLKPIEALTRDLFSEPLSRTELRDFDAVVFDPPRAGARAQAEALARARVPTVVAVSCNPVSFARDLSILIGGGYRVEAINIFDQFLFSAHVEMIAVLRAK